MDVRDAVELVENEMHYGLQKFGKYASTHEAASVIREEYEEFWDEIKRNNTSAAVKEAIQVAATALRFICEFTDKNKL